MHFANSYLAFFRDLVVPNYTDDLKFMEDNASIYTAKEKRKKVKEWFEERGIRVTVGLLIPRPQSACTYLETTQRHSIPNIP